METELIKEKFSNIEKWKEKVDPVIWQSKTSTERIMDTLDELKQSSKDRRKDKRQTQLMFLMAFLSPIITYIVYKVLGGNP